MSSKKLNYISLVFFLFIAFSLNGYSQTLPTDVTVEPFYDINKPGLSFKEDQLSIMGMVEVPGLPQHFLVLGYFGYVWSLYPDTTNNWDPTKQNDYTRAELADFNTQIMKGWEQGAIAGAFDPHFKDNHYFYIIYQKYSDPQFYHGGVRPNGNDGPGNPGIVVVERWILSNDFKSLNRDTTIFSADHGRGYGTHTMTFGKDNMLYISLDSYSKNSWDMTDFERKILRIDVSKQDPGMLYSIPNDNPYYNSSIPGIKKEIWAIGFRNTWTLSSDYITGSLWGAEIGQVTWEEVNIIKKGQNYGWAEGGDGQPASHGAGIEGPCSDNTASGSALTLGGTQNPYSYSGALSNGEKMDCSKLTNPEWSFHHAGQNTNGTNTAVPGLRMNCIIMGDAIRGDTSSPLYGYHLVTDINRNYFVALKEGIPHGTNIGGLPSSIVFTGDLNHNGIVSFSEDSYGNQYVVLGSSSGSGAFAWHDIYRIKHQDLPPLTIPRTQVTPVAVKFRGTSWERTKGAYGIRTLNLAGLSKIQLPKGMTRVSLYSLLGKLIWTGHGAENSEITLPSDLGKSINGVNGIVWTKFSR